MPVSIVPGNTIPLALINTGLGAGNINPLVLELTASEDLHGDIVVLNAKHLDGNQKKLANIMASNTEADLGL